MLWPPQVAPEPLRPAGFREDGPFVGARAVRLLVPSDHVEARHRPSFLLLLLLRPQSFRQSDPSARSADSQHFNILAELSGTDSDARLVVHTRG